MIDVTTYADRNVAVLGMSRTGIAAGHALLAGGARVFALDDMPAARERARECLGAAVVVDDAAQISWSDIATLVVSPGVPLHFPKPHPVIRKARAAGCEILGDIELFARARAERTRLVLITGTNGKSTTTALLGHIIAESGLPVAVGGNIGKPVLEMPGLPDQGVYVVEISSFQLDLTSHSQADIAILLNITPDHLDRHGDMAGYVAAKRRIFDGLSVAAGCIVGVDDTYGENICSDLRAAGHSVVPLSIENETAESGEVTTCEITEGIVVRDGKLCEVVAGTEHPQMDLRDLSHLPGSHNWQNVAAAYAAARGLGLARAEICTAIETFPGLAHRMEQLGKIGTVRFVNDSKATNADATARALACYTDIFLILGGVAKSGGIEGLKPFFSHIAKVYLIGEAAAAFAAALDDVPHIICGDLETAVSAAFADASSQKKEAVILLSPACASFDQFENFEARGAAFRAWVERLRQDNSMAGGAV